MSLLANDNRLQLPPAPDLNPDMVRMFIQAVGRPPQNQDEGEQARWAWDHKSYDDFVSWARQMYGGTPELPPTYYAMTGNMPLGGGGLPMLPSAMPMVPSTAGGIIGTIGNIGGIISGISSIFGGGGGQKPTGGGILDGLFGPNKAQPGGPAPKATFFGGECPPGRKLKRIGMGRDICVKTPRMNPFNPRALARADRRVTSFARRSKAILQGLGYHVSPRKKSIAKKKRSRR